MLAMAHHPYGSQIEIRTVVAASSRSRRIVSMGCALGGSTYTGYGNRECHSDSAVAEPSVAHGLPMKPVNEYPNVDGSPIDSSFVVPWED